METTYPISGMHCGACVRRIQSAVGALGVTAEVSLSPPQLHITGTSTPARSALQAAVAAVGDYTLGDAIVTTATAAEALAEQPQGTGAASWFSTYRPLLLILGYVTIAAFAGTSVNGSFRANVWMNHFMAGFFLVFSGFKLFDLRAFANAYAAYDLVAARFRPWGFLYPFIEFALGVSYLFDVAPVATNWICVLVMGISSAGVIAALRRRVALPCACLGSVLKLPMSTVTLIEDVGMLAMAVMALAFRR
jgi:copper chaperone CopZ